MGIIGAFIGLTISLARIYTNHKNDAAKRKGIVEQDADKYIGNIYMI